MTKGYTPVILVSRDILSPSAQVGRVKHQRGKKSMYVCSPCRTVVIPAYAGTAATAGPADGQVMYQPPLTLMV